MFNEGKITRNVILIAVVAFILMIAFIGIVFFAGWKFTDRMLDGVYTNYDRVVYISVEGSHAEVAYNDGDVNCNISALVSFFKNKNIVFVDIDSPYEENGVVYLPKSYP